VDPLKIFDDRDANRIRSTSAREYFVAFWGAVGRAFKQRGALDGETYAASAPIPTPDPAELAKAAGEYQASFAGAFRHAMQLRGAQDGEAAAAAIDVASLHRA
jgi:hypothetical protein